MHPFGARSSHQAGEPYTILRQGLGLGFRVLDLGGLGFRIAQSCTAVLLDKLHTIL